MELPIRPISRGEPAIAPVERALLTPLERVAARREREEARERREERERAKARKPRRPIAQVPPPGTDYRA